MKQEIIIIDDDAKLSEDSLIWTLRDKYGDENVIFINKSQEGIDYVKKNLDKNLIIILDYEFSVNEKKGNEVFDEITKLSNLIPIIFFTGSNKIENEVYRELINKHAFAIVNKMTTSDDLMVFVEKATLYFESNLDNIIEDWIIEKDEDKDKPVFFTADGLALSLNEILNEIRNQSEIGKSFSRKLNELTIDLLIRNKEKLND